MNTLDILKNKIYTRESIKHLLGGKKFFKKKIVFTIFKLAAKESEGTISDVKP